MIATRINRRSMRPRFQAISTVAIARQVVEEAVRWLGEPLDDAWAVALAARAETAISHASG